MLAVAKDRYLQRDSPSANADNGLYGPAHRGAINIDRTEQIVA